MRSVGSVRDGLNKSIVIYYCRMDGLTTEVKGTQTSVWKARHELVSGMSRMCVDNDGHVFLSVFDYGIFQTSDIKSL